MQMKILFTIMALLSGFYVFPANAQQKETQRTDTAFHGLKPVWKSTLGNVLSNTIPSTMMKNLLDSSLHARDKKGKLHPVVSFNFGYSTSESYVNDSTGRKQTSPLYYSFHFNSGRLDSIWKKRVGDMLKQGDKLYFERIIAEDKNGIQYLSSPLYFIIR